MMHASIAEREQSRTFHCAKIQFFFGLEHRNQVFLHENLEVWNKRHYLAPKNRKNRGFYECGFIGQLNWISWAINAVSLAHETAFIFP
jgi:hypothetical protein